MSHFNSRPSMAATVAAVFGTIVSLSEVPVNADTVDDLIVFSAGTTARAADVNANFNAVANAVNGNDAAIAALAGLAVHERTTYVPATTDATANGQALLAAVADVGDIPGNEEPWNVVLQPGVYDLAGSQLILPTNVHLIGSGMNRTTIEATRVAAGPTAEAAVVVGASGTHLEELTVTNRETFGGAAIAVYTDQSIQVVRCQLGQNTNVAGGSVDSYALIGTFAVVENSNLIGFTTSTRIGIGLQLSQGGRISGSTLSTQGTADGAAIVVDAASTSSTTVSGTHIRGFGNGRGFIHHGSGTLTILFSEFTQGGGDGLVTNGNVRIGASMREKTISVVGGSAACAQNFSSAMVALAGC